MKTLNFDMLSILLVSLVAIASSLGVVLESIGKSIIVDKSKDEISETSCGNAALTAILRLEGRSVTSDRVGLHLSKKPQHSLMELRVAAAEFGLILQGIRLDRTSWPIDRPALVHFLRGRGGHFAVLRPVGHTGHLVQIIDPTLGVEVVDAENLFSSPSWTGMASVPVRPWEDYRLPMLLTIPCLFIMIIISYGYKVKNRV